MGKKVAMKKAAMKKAMKKTMKKSMKKKAMKASKIARGKLSKALVLRGNKEKTVGGLTKDKLPPRQRGKVVSKKASTGSKKRYTGSKAEAWMKACKAARKALKITGFVAIGGKTAQGKALYAKAKAIQGSA